MLKYNDKEEFKLCNKLQYDSKGDVAYCEHLDMFAPSRNQYSEVIKLKQGYHKAQSEVAARYMPFMKNLEEIKGQLSKDTDEELSSEQQAKQIMEAIYTSSIDIEEFFKQFRILCTKGAVKFPTGESLTELIIDKLSLVEFEGLVGNYLAFFIVGFTKKPK